jgi:acylphosphatase
MTTHHFIIKGRVQGVGFRFFTYNLAKQCKIKGWVLNRYTNDVEVVAQGGIVQMAIFRKELQKGPSFAKIDSIDEDIIDHEEYDNFDIKY